MKEGHPHCFWTPDLVTLIIFASFFVFYSSNVLLDNNTQFMEHDVIESGVYCTSPRNPRCFDSGKRCESTPCYRAGPNSAALN
ncbi:hypothetical protein K469DRAFT_296623 [Zopfia rhizophila CBS 207.26]|uniref:Uncharacterized protein n=1 Tax=Zopfia rhizophila CBS 207.26 TaxID=1314779 RepID=A0A6A6DPC1_9PEZI|nr:hypothetical protein K469DRAFT_296623 [Zopfia rhizophila CBS 207.26]